MADDDNANGPEHQEPENPEAVVPNEAAQEDDHDADLPIEPEILENLPPDVRRVAEFAFGMQRVGPMPSPFASKINEGHITRILDISEKDSERDFDDIQRSRWFTLGYAGLIVGVFVFLTIFLVGKNAALYTEILKLTVVFLGGAGSGFGVKSYMDKRRTRG